MESLALSFLHITLFLFTIISLNSFSSYASQLTYTDHCASMVPNSNPNESKFKDFPHGRFQVGYYLGGDKIVGADTFQKLRQKQVTLRIKSVYETDVFGIHKVGATLLVTTASSYYRVGNFTRGKRLKNRKRFPSSIMFSLDGFWSEYSGKICMVGTGSGYNMQLLEVVLKLYNVVNSSNTISTLAIGSLESLSSKNEVSYFEPISLFIFPRVDYEYSLDTIEAKTEFSNEGEVVPGLSINPVSFCANIFPMINGKYDLQYQSECNSAKYCSPVNGKYDFQLPYIVSLKELVCLDVKQRVRVLIGFRNSGDRWSFNPNTTLVGEGWWDEEKNQLSIVGCHFLGMEKSMTSVYVGDCSTRMILRFPKIWSIKDASSIVGQIWSNKTVGDSGYFKRMVLRKFEDQRVQISGTKYEYSQLDKVRKVSPRHEQLKNKGIRYPDVYSSDMRFDISVRISKRRVAWGYSVPLVVNDQIQQLNLEETFPSNSSNTLPSISPNSSSTGLYNVSYKINIKLLPNVKLGEEKSMLNTTTNVTEPVNVSAEGIYDAEAGILCMVGCRNLGSKNQIPSSNSLDCEVIVKFQFPPLDAKNNGGYIKGSIESVRKNSDPLYFKQLDVISAAFYTAEASQISKKVDMEVIMILLCTTLACVFVGLQLYHVKRNPDMLPLISFVMSLILTLGNMVPLVLNFESLFAQNHDKKRILLGSEWLEVNEIAVRLIVMVAFLLQFRLLQLTWSARKVYTKQKDLWIAEKKVLYVILTLYAAGFLIALLVHQSNTLQGDVVYSSSLSQQHSLWEDLKSFSGLVLDGFLLPQILLNLFMNSKGNALSCSFYFGISLVRLIPHAYDLFEALVYVDGSSLYEDEIADYYSTAWDIIIPLVSLMFAAIIHLQQQFGGCSILSWRINTKGVEEYKKVPVVTEA
ncbi:uncharacterized protein LOC114416189 [Glycine soja]|uniref:RING-type E3 ubiquitin transferase n=1 Tax=Glycine soja TaxID=3848 RepID=A0A445KDU1_GLYSO|nr:uncharacterized protein LOC114416189 [Glycine soja]RZC09012.1 hypothetical protein D0Y65_015643 [Glycine soja]